jgi:hypothetical protein
MYELRFYFPEDGILHSHRRENLKSYIATLSVSSNRYSVMLFAVQHKTASLVRTVTANLNPLAYTEFPIKESVGTGYSDHHGCHSNRHGAIRRMVQSTYGSTYS